MGLGRLRDELDRVAQQRVDPEVVARAVRESYTRMLLAGIGESLAHVVDEWVIDCDRDRLIDEARD